MVACTLAFDLGRESARDFVHRTPLYRPTLWPQLLRSEDTNFTTQGFVSFITAEAHDLLTFGSSYLRYVLRDPEIHMASLLICPQRSSSYPAEC